MCCKSLLFLDLFWWQCSHFDFRKRMGFTCIFENDGEKSCKNWLENEFCILPRYEHQNFKLCFCFIPDPKLWSHLSGTVPKHLNIKFQVITCCFCRKWWRECLGQTERSLFHIHLWAEVEQIRSRWKFNNLPSFGPEIFRESKYTKKPETVI